MMREGLMHPIDGQPRSMPALSSTVSEVPLQMVPLLQLPRLNLSWQLCAPGSRPSMLCLLTPAQRPLLRPSSAHTIGGLHGLKVGLLGYPCQQC